MKKLVAAIAIIAKDESSLNEEEAKALGEQIGIDWETVDFTVEQFMWGFDEELEHGTVNPETNITDDDPEMTAKIAWVHLKQDPTAYDDEVVVDACDYPRTDPMITRGTPGNPEDVQQGGPQHDSLMEPRWVG